MNSRSTCAKMVGLLFSVLLMLTTEVAWASKVLPNLPPSTTVGRKVTTTERKLVLVRRSFRQGVRDMRQGKFFDRQAFAVVDQEVTRADYGHRASAGLRVVDRKPAVVHGVVIRKYGDGHRSAPGGTPVKKATRSQEKQAIENLKHT